MRVNTARDATRNTAAYPADSHTPRVIASHATGVRNRSANASHSWVGRYGCRACSDVRPSRIWLMIAIATVATAAPTPESVSVEKNTPIADRPATPITT